jgi:hypothetical protein
MAQVLLNAVESDNGTDMCIERTNITSVSGLGTTALAMKDAADAVIQFCLLESNVGENCVLLHKRFGSDSLRCLGLLENICNNGETQFMGLFSVRDGWTISDSVFEKNEYVWLVGSPGFYEAANLTFRNCYFDAVTRAVQGVARFLLDDCEVGGENLASFGQCGYGEEKRRPSGGQIGAMVVFVLLSCCLVVALSVRGYKEGNDPSEEERFSLQDPPPYPGPISIYWHPGVSQSIVIPSWVVVLVRWSFDDRKSLEYVTFEPDSQLEWIDACAFYKSGLKSIVIPSSVVVLGASSFCYCESLESVRFESGSRLERIDDSAFYGSGLQSIVIPSSVVVLGKESFRWCKSLESVTFESRSRLERIEESAFSGSGLKSIVIPSSVVSLGRHCFYRCRQLESVTHENGSRFGRLSCWCWYGIGCDSKAGCCCWLH